MATNSSSLGRTIAVMALFVIAGIPLVAYLWETLNEILALEAEWSRVLISIPVLLLLIGLLVLLSRRLTAWTQADRSD